MKCKPAFYRVIAGNVRDVTALSMTLSESGMKNGIIVADKGFASEANFDDIEAANIKYIVPLKRNSKRNSSEIDYTAFKCGGKLGFDGHFMSDQYGSRYTARFTAFSTQI